MTSLELRPRLASEIVDAAFQLYRRYFTELVTLSALCLAPYIVLQLLVTGGRIDAEEMGNGVMFALMGGGWLFGSFLEAAVVLAVSNSYLRGQPDVAGALRQTISRFFTVLLSITAKWLVVGSGIGVALILATIVSVLVIGVSGGADAVASGGIGAAVIGFLVVGVAMLLSVPIALYFFASYFAVPATVMLEGLGVRAGLRRSRELSRGNKKRIYGALGLPLLIWLLLQITLNFTLQLLPGPQLLAFLIEQAAYVLGQPIMSVIATLVYYDARIRKEAFDIEVMAAELGVASSGAAVPPAQPT